MSAAADGLTLAELAAALGGTVEGDPALRIHGVAGLEDAAPGTIVRVDGARYLKPALESPASALLVEESLTGAEKPCVRVRQLRIAYIRALELFAPVEHVPPGVHPSAVVDGSAEIAEGCAIGAGAVIGPRVRLAGGVVLHPCVVLMEDVEVGPDCVLYPHAVLYPRTVLGARVRIHAGAVLGADGFGYEWTGEQHLKRPHNGRVRVGDDVEIGANSAIDRATTGETVIGPGTKIDNLVQIGHNVRMGAHCVMVSQSGLAGSVTAGNGVVVAGQSGAKDNVRLGDGVVLVARAAAWGDLPEKGLYSGSPARPHSEEKRIQAAMRQLPELLKRVRELELQVGGSAEAAAADGTE